MVVTNQLRNQHLLWRAGFGPMAEEVNQLSTSSQASYVKALFKASDKTPSYLDVADSAIKGLIMGLQEAGRQQTDTAGVEQKKKELFKRSQEAIKSLNLAWLDQMVNGDMQLLEKMSLFWHGHFATRNLNLLYQQQLLQIIRRNALGNFGDLLREVSKSASMINFLNNNQNRKDHPNENFAREVMELFTLGRGNYTETDVKEAARAFTGWGANLPGDFVFRPGLHDEGDKTIFGKTGPYNGDDMLNMLLEREQTARFICGKIYVYFVNEKRDEEKINWMAKRFYHSGYNIGSLMHDVFSSSWFYDPANIGSRIKSPVELLVGIRRMLPLTVENPEIQLTLQRLLGQLLFYPPNVAGWPGGKNWIDSSSLMLRMRIPQMIYTSDELGMRPKGDDDLMMGMKDAYMKRQQQMIRATIDWNPYLKNFESAPKERLLQNISSVLLQTDPLSPLTLKSNVDTTTTDNFIKTATIQLMSTPEYQLC